MTANNPSTPPPMIDRTLLARRQARAHRMGAETFLLDRVAEDLAERLSVVTRRFTRAADIATPDALLAERLAPLVDHVARAEIDTSERLHLAPASCDLAVSALGLQFINDLPGLMVQIRRALKPDGLFLAAMIGGETLTELRQAFMAAEAEIEGGISPRVIPFADLRDMGALLQRAGFALPVADMDRLTVRYADVFALMRDLRRMGASNVLFERRRVPLRRATLMRMASIYHERFADPDGRIRATFDVLWLSGWAPHESQQKPLKPGSAQVNLADAVKGLSHRKDE